jgi:uncharacterized delta-60 repeat protein
MSLTLLGILSSQVAGVPYWLTTLGNSDLDQGFGVTNDSLGNSYVVGRNYLSGWTNFEIAKYDELGAVIWQNSFGSTGDQIGYGIAVDSSDNLYLIGTTTSSGTSFQLAKYNSSGTLQWQRQFGGGNADVGTAVSVDSSANVYVAGYTKSAGAGGDDFLLAKYNTSGTLQWQRVLGGSSQDRANGVSVDSAGNSYIFGDSINGAGNNDFLLAKYNSSGTLQWQRVLGDSSSEQGKAVSVDTSGNVYVSGFTISGGTLNALLVKYDSFGNLTWQKILGGAGNEQFLAIDFDSVGDVYVSGDTTSSGAGSNDFLLAKYNSSGTLQWQRVLGGSSSEVASSISIDQMDNLYVLGSTGSAGAGYNDFLLAKLPSDGSKAGTYLLNGVSMVYAASSLTASTGTLTAATSSLTAATSSLTSSSSSLTSTTSALTSYLVNL